MPPLGARRAAGRGRCGCAPPSAQRGAGEGVGSARGPPGLHRERGGVMARKAPSLPPGLLFCKPSSARPYPVLKNKSAPDTDSYSCLRNSAPCGVTGFLFTTVLVLSWRRLYIDCMRPAGSQKEKCVTAAGKPRGAGRAGPSVPRRRIFRPSGAELRQHPAAKIVSCFQPCRGIPTGSCIRTRERSCLPPRGFLKLGNTLCTSSSLQMFTPKACFC